MKLIIILLVGLSLAGCEQFMQAQKYCDEALGAVELICSLSPVIPVGAAGGELVDPNRPECVVLSAQDRVPLEYCRP